MSILEGSYNRYLFQWPLKQGRNLRRESAFYVTLAVQVSALKRNLRHLRLNLPVTALCGQK